MAPDHTSATSGTGVATTCIVSCVPRFLRSNGTDRLGLYTSRVYLQVADLDPQNRWDIGCQRRTKSKIQSSHQNRNNHMCLIWCTGRGKIRTLGHWSCHTYAPEVGNRLWVSALCRAEPEVATASFGVAATTSTYSITAASNSSSMFVVSMGTSHFHLKKVAAQIPQTF